MANNDIGIDLGTKTIIIAIKDKGIVLSQPCVVAVDLDTDKVLAIGDEAFEMVGRTPAHIQAIFPLEKGVISNYNVTKYLVKELLAKVSPSFIVKPRICVCTPSSITGIENNAIIEAAIAAGARQVFLIEEPLAAAIGCDIDFFKPGGHMIIDIGGGTTDTAIISLGGKVISKSLKIAGNSFDEEIMRHIRLNHHLNIGLRTAEQIKKDICNADKTNGFNEKTFVKGMDLISHLPKKIELCTDDLYEPILECASQIALLAKQTLEKTPPELSGDILNEGIYLTGGGSLLKGLDTYLSKILKVPVFVSKDTINNVVKGTLASLEFTNQLESGFRDATPGMSKR